MKKICRERKKILKKNHSAKRSINTSYKVLLTANSTHLQFPVRLFSSYKAFSLFMLICWKIYLICFKLSQNKSTIMETMDKAAI